MSKRYADGTVAVDDLSLEIPDGEVVMLVGPSGCGKTTTMKMINRLVEPSAGRVLLDGEDVARLDPVQLRRRLGYVIQQVGLFPHHTVADNVATVPRLLGWDRRRTRDRVTELLELVGLEPDRHARRYPHELSGGQRQRVGVARALAADPPVLLMDEPFGAVDPIARDHLQAEFADLQRRLRKTVVFVTHDVDEAVRLGDRIAVLRDGGRLEQYAAPAQLLAAPATPFVAEFVGGDRALRRLAVTPVSTAEPTMPVVIDVAEDLAEAGRRMRDAEASWCAVLVDGRLTGWLPLAAASGPGRAADAARPVNEQVTDEATLQTALAAVLGNDTGWVAVERAGRFAGVLTAESVRAALRRSGGADRSEA